MLLQEEQPGLLTAKQLAKRWGVTAATVRNYRDAGMVIAGRNHDGVETYDVAFCDKWRTDHKPGMGHGGRRAGAGRKNEDGVNVGTVGGAEAAGEIPLISDVQKQAARLKTENINLGSAEEIIGSWSLAAAQGRDINPSLIRGASETLKAASERLEYDKVRGTLVDREDVSRTLGEHLNTIRMSIDGLPARMAQAVMGELALPPNVADRLRAVLESEVRSVCVALAENPFGTPVALAAA